MTFINTEPYFGKKHSDAINAHDYQGVGLHDNSEAVSFMKNEDGKIGPLQV